MITAPLAFEGLHESDTDWSWALALRLAGVLGKPPGVTGVEAELAGLVPTALVAVTVKV